MNLDVCMTLSGVIEKFRLSHLTGELFEMREVDYIVKTGGNPWDDVIAKACELFGRQIVDLGMGVFRVDEQTFRVQVMVL